MAFKKLTILVVIAISLFVIDITYSNYCQPVLLIKKQLKQLLIERKILSNNQVFTSYINGGKLYQSDNNLYSYYFLATDLSSYKIVFLVCQFKNGEVQITNVTEEGNHKSLIIYSNPLK